MSDLEYIIRFEAAVIDHFNEDGTIAIQGRCTGETIIRCRNCKHADNFGHCNNVMWWNGPDDYCSKGERK